MRLVSSGFIPTDGSLTDFGRGPWSTFDQYFDIIPKAYRSEGGEFLVKDSGSLIEYRLVNGTDKVHAVQVAVSAVSEVTSWISPPVDELVTALPGSPADGYRVLYNNAGTWTIQEYDLGTTSWDILYDDGTAGIALVNGMAVIVGKVEIGQVVYTNQIYVYNDGVFENKTEHTPNWDLYYTSCVSNKRKVWDLTESPNNVLDVRAVKNSGIYAIKSDIQNLPAEFLAYDPVRIVFLEVHYRNDDNLMYKVSSADNSYIQVKSGGTYGAWKSWTEAEQAVKDAANKTSIHDSDGFAISDHEDSGKLKTVLWSVIKSTIESVYAMWKVVSDKVELITAKALNMQNKKIEGLADGTEAGDAINKGQHDTKMDKDPSAVDVGTLTDASVIQFWKVDTIKKITWEDIKATLKTYFESVWDFGHNIYSQLGTTALTQRENLRFKGFLKATDNTPDTDVEIDETKTEVVEHIHQYRLTLEDKEADSGTGATAGTDTLDTGTTPATDEYENMYAILTYTAADNEREICKIVGNSDTGVLTFTANRENTGGDFDAGIDWIILEHHDFQGDETPLIEGDITQHDYVVILPALTAENDSLELRVYTNDEATATNDKRIWILPDGVQTVAGESEYSIEDKAAGLLFYQNFAKTNWDLFSKYVKAV